jgi:hypothetical protein
VESGVESAADETYAEALLSHGRPGVKINSGRSTAEDQLIDTDEHGELPDLRGYCYATMHQDLQHQKKREILFFNAVR